MKIACIQTNRPDTEHIIRMFACGCDGQIISPAEFMVSYSKYDAAAMYGVLRGSLECRRICKANGMDYFYIDHAYFLAQRDYTKKDGWYRVTKNDHVNKKFISHPDDRWNKYFAEKIKVLPWRKQGNDIIISPPSIHMIKVYGPIYSRWTERIIAEISKYVKNKNITMRAKPKGTAALLHKGKKLSELMQKWWALVSFNSNVAVDAMLAGVPVYVSEHSVLFPYADVIKNISDPKFWERQPVLNLLSYSQFTLKEFHEGYAFEVVRNG